MKTKQIIKLYGIKIKNRYNYVVWDGEFLNTKKLKEQEIMHEIGHNIVAKRKYLPDYGLGSALQSNHSIYNELLEEKSGLNIGRHRIEDHNVIEELYACILEFCFSAFNKQDFKKLMEERYFIRRSNDTYTFEENSKPDFRKDIRSLIKRNIISKDWIPTKLLPYTKPIHIKRMNKFKEFITSCRN